MVDFDPVPDIEGLRKGLKFALYTLLVGLGAWALIFLAIFAVRVLVWGW